MRCSINQGPSKRSSQQVAKGVTLLEQPRDNPPRLHGTILQGGGRGVPVKTAHGDSEQSATGEELLIGLAETRAELEHDEKNVVHNKRPLATPAVGGNAKGDGADGSEHEHEGDAPGDICYLLAELLRQLRRGQRDREEVEGIPAPREECDLGGLVPIAKVKGV